MFIAGRVANMPWGPRGDYFTQSTRMAVRVRDSHSRFPARGHTHTMFKVTRLFSNFSTRNESRERADENRRAKREVGVAIPCDSEMDYNV